jgi:hypothetical protein
MTVAVLTPENRRSLLMVSKVLIQLANNAQFSDPVCRLHTHTHTLTLSICAFMPVLPVSNHVLLVVIADIGAIERLLAQTTGTY